MNIFIPGALNNIFCGLFTCIHISYRERDLRTSAGQRPDSLQANARSRPGDYRPLSAKILAFDNIIGGTIKIKLRFNLHI